MTNNLVVGILLVIIAGIMEGTYPLPTRYTPRWRWEHIWGAGSLMSILLVAWPVALITVPDLGAILFESGLKTLAIPALLGAGWGAGGIFFGLGVNAVGIALGVSLILGLIALLGSILPLVIYHPEQLSQPGGQMMIFALVVMLGGIILSGIAGGLREKAREQRSAAAVVGGASQAVDTFREQKATPYKLGLLFCVLSGALSPMVNFALIQGDAVRQVAIRHGASQVTAGNALWLVVFNAAYGVFVLYAVYRMIRNRSASEIRTRGSATYWILAAAMGLLWAGGVIVYGVGVAYMGGFGAYGGWPLMVIVAIAAGNLTGILLGEWENAGRKPLTVMAAALVVLFAAAILLGVANRMLAA